MATSDVSGDDQELEPLAREGEHVAPTLRGAAFHCLHCGVLSTQGWRQLQIQWGASDAPVDYWWCRCNNCREVSIWKGEPTGRLLDPPVGGGPRPHIDMPVDVWGDYEEARLIVGLSPRGSCALLRLAVQKLCGELGESGENIDKDIANLVDRGLDIEVQQALDSLRVIGNNAVHPGEMDLTDDTDTATALFSLVNFIVEDRIAQPKKRKAIFDKLPEGAKAAIRKRDGKQDQAATAPS